MAEPVACLPRAGPGPVLFACLLCNAAAAQAQTVTLESSDARATAGYFQLTWDAPGPARLVEATRADFYDGRVIYEGADTATVVSGKPDGHWFYRLESPASGRPLSASITVTVAHHSLLRAAIFFSIGATVFIATLALIVLGRRSVDR